MRRLYKYAMLALAIITISSCAKDELANIGEPEEESAQLITASFSNNEGTKTTLSSNGLTPVWSEGDKIMLYNSDGTKDKEITLSKTEGPSSDYGKLSEDCSSFTFKKPTSFGTDNIMHALYPSSCAKGISDTKTLLFAIPTSTKGRFAEANICGGKIDLSTSQKMSFKNLTSIIKINDKTSSITKMTITANAGSTASNMISGWYEVTDFTTANATVKYHSNGADKITITPEDYVGPYFAAVAPVPVSGQIGSYYRGETQVGAKTLSSTKDFAVNKIYNIGFANPTGTIGVFSVSNSKKVGFAKGNLQAVYSTSTSSYSWQFAENQWTYVGNAQGNTTIDSQIDGKKVDLFGWSTAATNYGINTSQSSLDYDGDFKDWGNAVLPSSGTWCTLTGGSSGEWQYLLTKRTIASTANAGEGKSYQRTTLTLSNKTTVKGIIIAPDNSTEALSSTTTWTAWQSLESKGFVFLPAAGYRMGSGVNSVGSNGYYWSSTPNFSDKYFPKAHYLYFDTSEAAPHYFSDRRPGHSVRLVQE